MPNKSETIANIAITVVCVVLSGFILVRLFAPSRPDGRADNTYALGDQLEPIAELDPVASSDTLLLVIRSSCTYCTASMPLYRRIVKAHNPNQLRIIALTPEPIERARSYIASQHLDVDQVISFRPGSLRLKATPTVLLIDKKRTVLGQWTGQLGQSQEREMLTKLGMPSLGS